MQSPTPRHLQVAPGSRYREFFQETYGKKQTVPAIAVQLQGAIMHLLQLSRDVQHQRAPSTEMTRPATHEEVSAAAERRALEDNTKMRAAGVEPIPDPAVVGPHYLASKYSWMTPAERRERAQWERRRLESYYQSNYMDVTKRAFAQLGLGARDAETKTDSTLWMVQSEQRADHTHRNFEDSSQLTPLQSRCMKLFYASSKQCCEKLETDMVEGNRIGIGSWTGTLYYGVPAVPATGFENKVSKGGQGKIASKDGAEDERDSGTEG